MHRAQKRSPGSPLQSSPRARRLTIESHPARVAVDARQTDRSGWAELAGGAPLALEAVLSPLTHAARLAGEARLAQRSREARRAVISGCSLVKRREGDDNGAARALATGITDSTEMFPDRVGLAPIKIILNVSSQIFCRMVRIRHWMVLLGLGWAL